MKSRLTAFAGRAVAVAILVLLVGLLYVGGVAPVLREFDAADAAIADARTLVSHYHQAGTRVPQQRALLAQLAERQETENGFLAGANETLAAADLQSRIKTIVENARGELKSTQILPAQQEGQFRRVAVRGEMTMTLPVAQRVLYTIETASPLLFLDNVDIRSHAADRQQDRNEDIVVLEVSLDVYGYMRGTK